MANTTKKILREGYNRLKKTLERISKPNKDQALPQLALQPIRNKKYLRGTDLY
jgi:hypothetical protein